MVCKVMSSGSSMASAIGYNEDKVKEGCAKVISEVNPDPDHATVLDTFARLESRNIRSQNVSFHMSVNPSSNEKLTESQIKEFIGELMNGLGYGKQPYVIYRHNDIERTHFHVVSIRVNHSGKKIPDRLERLHCNGLLKEMAPRYGIQLGNGNSKSVSFEKEQGKELTKSVGKKM